VELQRSYDEISATGAEILAVSTDNLQGAETAVRNFEAEFPILYTSRDPSIPEAYDRFNKFGDGLASAAVFIIGTDGVIRWQSLGSNYQHQVSGEEVLEALGAIR